MTTIATFAYGPTHVEIAPGAVTDGSGQVSVPTGASLGSNAGAGVLAAIRAGLVPVAPKTAGFNTAVTAAQTSIAAVASTPTGAEVQAALTAVLAAVSALTAA